MRHTTRCSTLQHVAAHCNTSHGCDMSISPQYATRCNTTLQHAATHRGGSSARVKGSCVVFILSIQYVATRCNTLQHTATHCNTPQGQQYEGQWQLSDICPQYSNRCILRAMGSYLPGDTEKISEKVEKISKKVSFVGIFTLKTTFCLVTKRRLESE